MTRREFVQTTAAGIAASWPMRDVAAATFDLVLKGGRVIDPAAHLDRILDVGVRDGRIAALQQSISASEATEIVDAAGKLVTPGLIDIHAHIDRDLTPAHCLSTGVTSLVDAGSRGADNIDELLVLAADAPNRVRILLNLGRTGLGGQGELLDFSNGDAAAARKVIEAHRTLIIGVKARLSRNVAGLRDADAIDRAHEVTAPLQLPLMVHIGQTASPLSTLLPRLRPGDIVTHVYAPPPNGILDEAGRVRPDVVEARRRGIRFDIGNGRNGHITWEVAERAMQQGFLPDTISSDLTAPGRTDRVFDFPTVLSKFLLLGMSLDQVIACATSNAARSLTTFQELGTLRVGAVADLVLFELRAGDFDFVDNMNTKRIGHQKLVPHAVVAQGRLVRDAAA